MAAKGEQPESRAGTAAEAGDELLAQGVARFMPGVRYSAREGYGRLTRPLELASAVADPVVCIDIESLGFIGRPLFLIGALHAAGREGCLTQYLARDYSEEEAVLRAFLDEAAAAPLWITFNGRTFDLPFLALRAAYFRLDPPRPGRHIDLLPVARRRWGARLPDCRLQTLERAICGRPPRRDDLPGGEIPTAYHAFVRTREPWEMLRVLQHNSDDLTTLLALLRAAQADEARSNSEGPAAADKKNH